MHEVVDLDLEPSRTRRRPEQHRPRHVRLRPFERPIVEPARSPVELEPEPKLAELPVAVRVRPPDAVYAAALGKGREERPVSEQRGRERAQFPHGATFRQFGTVSATFCVPFVP
jgi:hypothetical protein